MGLKEAGLRGSLRSVSTGVGIPDSGADHRWDMDADPVPDRIGALNLTLNGPTVEGDNRISLDGVDDDGTINDPLTALVTGGNDGGGLGVWFRIDDVDISSAALWANDELGGDTRFLFRYRSASDGGLTFSDDAANRESGWEAASNEIWYFGAVRWDSSFNGEILVDNSLEHQETFDFGSSTNTSNLEISNFRDDNYFPGELGISWIWLEEPSDAQLTEAFDATKGIYK